MIWIFDDKGFIKMTSRMTVVYMMIAKYSLTGDKKGWYGTTRQMEEMIFVTDISYATASRCIAKLLDAGLIEKREGAYFVVSDCNKSVSDCNKLVSNCNKLVSNCNNIEYNNKNKGIEGDARTRTCGAPASAPEDDLFIVTAAAFALQPKATPLKARDEAIAKQTYRSYTPEQKQALLQAVRNGYNKKHNFRFTVEDFRDENPFAEQRMTYGEYYSTFHTTDPTEGWRQVIPEQGEMYYVKP